MNEDVKREVEEIDLKIAELKKQRFLALGIPWIFIMPLRKMNIIDK